MMSNCEEFRPLLGAYADGQLEPIEADAVAAHVEQCGRCRQTFREQQRVQHVFDAYQPPAVSDARWVEMAKRLKAELEGQHATLKTRSRVEALEPTPQAQPSLQAEETSPRPPRAAEMPRPAPRSRPAVAQATTAPAPAMLRILKVRPRRPHARFGWVAHIVGAVAAAVIIAISLHSVWMEPDTSAGLIALARPQDVAIINIETLDPDYNVIIDTGDASEAVVVWVVPSRDEG